MAGGGAERPLYLQDQVKLDRFVLTLGGRYDWARIDNQDLLANTRTRRNDSAFSGRPATRSRAAACGPSRWWTGRCATTWRRCRPRCATWSRA
ncbi:TonB-dependent receptor [Achromobacter sp. Bel]|uniref:TonB-dependent receptor domain-containing protein n=1 Tax=Achromobacter sp. Bel TaxID=2727415 RepID=UPI001B7D50F8|nr:TonB-dependent receptor [Achromobacter sp. Bel]